MNQSYDKLNKITGWVVFAIATLVYLLTLEPTTSFWDCGEYIATAYKLEVGHPPGAPLFLLLANLFSNLAMGNEEMVAKWVNVMSALSSSFTILFLFWTITSFGKKIVKKSGELTKSNMLAVLGAGAVGALAYTFSDSFWFSAVEGEVYAMSSLFTAITFWAILKWEANVEKEGANRWIVLIFFLTGLSIGVHMLSMLTIPAIAMIYYFKKYPFTKKGFIIANIASIVILGVIFKIVVPQIVNLAGKFELLFVNTIGLPFNSGTIFFFIVLIAAIYFGIRYSRKKMKPILNLALLSFTFMLVGYSTFGVLVIRSNANPTIDENNPEDAVSLLAYLNREQYGDWPLVNGHNFNSPVTGRGDGNPVYVRDDEAGKYVISDDRKGIKPEYAPGSKSVLPRMWSQDAKHVPEYIKHIGKDMKDFYNPRYRENGEVNIDPRTGQPRWDLDNPRKYPSLSDNIKYLVNYQMGWMYFRYFMWNFSGRQNDAQGHGNLTDGNWISGISFLDEMRLGPQSDLPEHMANNKARNKYYMLPFILGLIGLLYHYKKDKKDAYVVLLFFLMTGLAIVFYLNQYPLQPRERDYAYVGSFYAFAIWIGLGVMAIFDFLSKKTAARTAAIVATGASLLLVPGLMAKENWDDHDRSNRYTARDIAKNYLDSCAPNAIIFTNGDNDTFPLWYVQEVEGYRTDVRIVNLSLLNTDWYIDQMKRAAYDSKPVPFSLEKDQYRQGTRDVVYFSDRGVGDRRWLASDMMKFIASDDAQTKVRTNGGKSFNYFPTKKLRIPVDKQKVIENGTVSSADTARILPYLDWDIRKNYLVKKELMILDLIAHNNWERPIYFSITVGNTAGAYLFLTQYFQMEGMAYRLVPFRTQSDQSGFGEVNTDKMYNNLMNEFQWGNLEDEDVYMDETNRRMTYSIRNNFGRLASALIDEGKGKKAEEVLDRCMEIVTPEKFSLDVFSLQLIESYFRAGAKEKGMQYAIAMGEIQLAEVKYFQQFKGNMANAVSEDYQRAMAAFNELKRIGQRNQAPELTTQLNQMQTDAGLNF